jgi:hypothetical protein
VAVTPAVAHRFDVSPGLHFDFRPAGIRYPPAYFFP